MASSSESGPRVERSSQHDEFYWSELIYSAMEDPVLWTNFLGAVADKLHALHAMLIVRYFDRPAIAPIAFVGATMDDFREYDAKWAAQDPFVKDLPYEAYAPRALRLSHELCPDHILEQTEIYQQYLRPRRWHYGGGIVLATGEAQSGLLTFLRPKEVGKVTEEECDFLRRICPSLERAVRLQGEYSQIRAERDMLAAHRDSTGVGTVLVNERARVLMANRAAQFVLDAAGPLRVHEDSLKVDNAEDHSQLMQAIAKVGSPRGHASRQVQKLSLSRGVGRPPLAIFVSSISNGVYPRIGKDQATACLHLLDAEHQSQADPAILEEMFGLTVAEARLACVLAEGASVQEAADALFVSVNTVRTHLKRTLEKTKCRRQAELVSLVVKLAVQVSSADAADE